MKIVLNELESLEFEAFYPSNFNTKSDKRYEILIGLGGNVGDVKKIFKRLFVKLRTDKRFDIIATSPLYKNPPFGFIHQNSFYNAVMVLKSNLGYIDFFATTSHIERVYGRDRKREQKDGPRRIDIDILLFSNMKINSPTLKIPHYGFYDRASVQIPLFMLGTKI